MIRERSEMETFERPDGLPDRQGSLLFGHSNPIGLLTP
jgi:hypothetical protein